MFISDVFTPEHTHVIKQTQIFYWQLWSLLSLAAVLSRAPSLVHAEFSAINTLQFVGDLASCSEQGLVMSLIEPLVVSYGGINNNKATS